MKNLILRIFVAIFWILWLLSTIASWILPTIGSGYVIFAGLDWINLLYIGIASAILFILRVVFYAAWTALEDSIW